MKRAPRYIVLVPTKVTERKFVDEWAKKHSDKRQRLYDQNVGQTLTPERVWQLFEWKNGGPIAEHKRASIQKNYIDNPPTPPAQDRGSLLAFILKSGGVIWRIFWLHCHSPSRYPIFDQHVYRAMRHIGGESNEIPKSSAAKARAYLDEYLPFHNSLRTRNKRKLDKALWTYGKFVKGRNAL